MLTNITRGYFSGTAEFIAQHADFFIAEGRLVYCAVEYTQAGGGSFADAFTALPDSPPVSSDNTQYIRAYSGKELLALLKQNRRRSQAL